MDGPHALPKLPGFDIQSWEDNGRKTRPQTLKFANGYAVTATPAAAAPPSVAWPKAAPAAAASPGGPSAAAPGGSRLPKWVEFDGKVLRFYAYFEETVPAGVSAEESWRTRRVVVLYHLADDTLQLESGRAPENDGLEHGTLLRRHRAQRGDGSPLDPTSLAVGGSLSLYGWTLQLVDADGFTRDFLASRGLPQPPALPYPTDPIQLRRADRAKPSGLSRNDPEAPSRYAEALMGKVQPSERKREYADQVLRFYCLWDDSNALFGDRRAYRLHLFLEDDTVEVVEQQQQGGGGGGAVFLRRGPLPKAVPSSTAGSPLRLQREACYRAEDFAVGGTVAVYGRAFLIYDVDDWTRAWYRSTLGRGDAELAALDVSRAAPAAARAALPPHNGYGAAEDALQNCVRLVPRAPRKDLIRLINNDRIVLRFGCRLVPDTTTNRRLANLEGARRFVLSFHMADDTLSIYEPPPTANSGIEGGKFLERAKAYKGRSETAWYTAQDLWVGARLVLHSRTFELQSADEYTLQYLENYGGAFPMADPARALAALRAACRGGGHEALRRAVEGAAAAGAGELRLEDFPGVLAAGGVELPPHQAITLFRYMRDAETGSVPAAHILAFITRDTEEAMRATQD